MASVRHFGKSCARLTRLAPGIVGAAVLAGLAGPAAAGDDDFFTHLHTEKAMANVTVSPGRAGPVDIAIELQTTDARPLVAKAVSVTLFNSPSGSDRQTIEATRTSDDRWHARASLPAPGRWMLGLGISVSDTEKVSIEAPILIGAAAAGAAHPPPHRH